MAVKTSVTPNKLGIEAIKKHLAEVKRDFLDNPTGGSMEIRVVNFNKQVCMEFGLTLYLSDPRSGDLMERIDVTEHTRLGRIAVER